MRRLIETELIKWKQKKIRKPLLVNGIRQVGKTWIITDFAKKQFDEILVVNFDLEPKLCEIFQISKDPKKILMELSVVYNRSIDSTRTLIFFDEIQGCNEALNALKYFAEAKEEYFIVAAGSYLGIVLSKGESFPVGKVEILELKPMSYKEFLFAKGEERLVEYMEAIDLLTPISEPIFHKLESLFREYCIVGGMPEVVQDWVLANDIQSVEKIQMNILNAYARDFSKYPDSMMIPKILGIWDSIEAQLSKENKKFKYSEVGKSARAREYENALEWLVAGNYVEKIIRVNRMEIPLRGFQRNNFFKLFMPDVGLLRKKANFPPSILSSIGSPNMFKGAIFGNVALQELLSAYHSDLFYWSEPNMELDFLIQHQDKILPIEVKAGKNTRSLSMTRALKKYDLPLGVRFSMRNLKMDGKILNIPFPLISELFRLIELAKQK